MGPSIFVGLDLSWLRGEKEKFDDTLCAGLLVVLTCALPATELFAQAGGACSCGASKSTILEYNVFHVYD